MNDERKKANMTTALEPCRQPPRPGLVCFHNQVIPTNSRLSQGDTIHRPDVDAVFVLSVFDAPCFLVALRTRIANKDAKPKLTTERSRVLVLAGDNSIVSILYQ